MNQGGLDCPRNEDAVNASVEALAKAIELAHCEIRIVEQEYLLRKNAEAGEQIRDRLAEYQDHYRREFLE